MSSVPGEETIYLSCVSNEFGPLREVLAEILLQLGYHVVFVDVDGAEGKDLRKAMQREIEECQGFLQLVGRAGGPNAPLNEDDFEAISYLEFENDCARAHLGRIQVIEVGEQGPSDEEILREVIKLWKREASNKPAKGSQARTGGRKLRGFFRRGIPVALIVALGIFLSPRNDDGEKLEDENELAGQLTELENERVEAKRRIRLSMLREISILNRDPRSSKFEEVQMRLLWERLEATDEFFDTVARGLWDGDGEWMEQYLSNFDHVEDGSTQFRQTRAKELLGQLETRNEMSGSEKIAARLLCLIKEARMEGDLAMASSFCDRLKEALPNAAEGKRQGLKVRYFTILALLGEAKVEEARKLAKDLVGELETSFKDHLDPREYLLIYSKVRMAHLVTLPLLGEPQTREEARKELREVELLLSDGLESSPDDAGLVMTMTDILKLKSDWYCTSDSLVGYRKALDTYRLALDYLQAALEANPDDWLLKQRQVVFYRLLGDLTPIVTEPLDRFDFGMRGWRRAELIAMELWDSNPADPGYAWTLIKTYLGISEFAAEEKDLGNLYVAEDYCREGLKVARQVAGEHPESSLAGAFLSVCLEELVIILGERDHIDDRAKLKDLVEENLRVTEKHFKRVPGGYFEGSFLAGALFVSVVPWIDDDDEFSIEEKIKRCRRALRILRNLEYPENRREEYVSSYGDGHVFLSYLLSLQLDSKEERSFALEAYETFSLLARDGSQIAVRFEEVFRDLINRLGPAERPTHRPTAELRYWRDLP